MTTTYAQPVMVDVTHPGSGPFQVHEFGPSALHAVSSFAVVRSDDPGKWPWFTSSVEQYAIAVSAALNSVVGR